MKGNTDAAARGVGAHQRHLAGGALRAPISCAECHAVPTSATHSNGTVDLTWGPLATSGGVQPQWNGASCSATYCHGAFTGGDAGNAPIWTQARASACGTCHGLPPPLPHPQNPDCGACHQGYTPTSVNVANHVDGRVDANGLACTSCHGDAARPNTALNPQLSAAPPTGSKGETAVGAQAVGAHQLHLTGGQLRDGLPCTECHVVPTRTSHSDGKVDLAFGALARSGGASPAWIGGTCASTYCHGAFPGGSTSYAPSWTQAKPSACGTCHGLPPAAPHPQNADCAACHPGYTATTVNKATHVDGKLDISGAACTACHGDAARPGTALNPLLSAAPPKDASGNSATTGRGVGAHQAHLVAGKLRGPMACTECHVAPPQGTHPNGPVDLAWGPLATAGGAAPSWDGTALTCSASYCHGNFKNGNTGGAPFWNRVDGTQAACGTCHGTPPGGTHPLNPACDGCHAGYTLSTVNLATHIDGQVQVNSLSCTSCHGDAARIATPANPQLAAAPPVGTKGETATSTKAVGAHQIHLRDGAVRAAIACTECHVVPTSTAHASGTVDVAFGTLARTGGVTPLWNGASCSASYCHGNFKNGNASYPPTWTAPATASCGTCHGTATNPAPGGTHPSVAADTCGQCHAGYTGTTVNLSVHLDGKVDVAAQTCSTCHGSATNAAPPAGTRGETLTTTRAVGAHQAHLVNTTLRSAAIACAECHTVPTAMNHANGTVGMSWGALTTTGGFAPTWTGATCTNYCHGSSLAAGGTITTPSWTGGTAQAACGTCHGNPPPAPHVQNAACGSCHTGYTNSTVVKATHIDGVLNVVAQTCSTCHGSATNAAPPAGTRGETLTTTRAVGAHQAHLVNTTLRSAAIACAECHTVPTAMNHASGTVGMSWGTLSRTGGFTPTWTGTTCTNYCHGSSLAAGGTITAPSWTGGTTQDACGTCHGVPPPAPHTTSTACGTCHAGYTATTVNLATHINGTVEVTSSHPAGWSASTVHGYQASAGGLQACTGCHVGFGAASGVASSSCNTCHGGTAWQTNCTFCHGTAGRTGFLAGTDARLAAAPPVGTQGETAVAQVAVGAHQAHVNPPATGALSSPFACTVCHPSPLPANITHVNGQPTAVQFSGVAGAGTYNRTASPTCSSTYCHGNFTGGNNATPGWTAASVACNSCHGIAPSTGQHGRSQHVSAGCGACHSGYTSTAVNATLHVNGAKNVGGAGTKIGTWSAPRSCTPQSGVGCHGNENW